MRKKLILIGSLIILLAAIGAVVYFVPKKQVKAQSSNGCDAGVTCYFVDANRGSDTTGNGSEANPFKTLTPLFRIGDGPGGILSGHDGPQVEVIMRGGTYIHNGSVLINGNDVTIKNYPGETPKIELETNLSDGTHLVTIRIFSWVGLSPERHNIILDGLEITGGYDYALKIDEVSRDITIRNCNIHDSGRDAVKIVGCVASDGGYNCNKNALFEFNEIHHTGIRDSGNCEGIDSMADYGTIVRNNYFHDIPTNGLYFKGGSKNILIESNYFYNVGTRAAEPDPTDSFGAICHGGCSIQGYIPAPPENFECIDCRANNNIVVGSAGNALRVMGAQNTTFTKNTLYDEARPYISPGGWLAQGAYLTDKSCSGPEPRELNDKAVFSNNIIIDSLQQGYPSYTYQNPIVQITNTWVAGNTLANLTADNNIYYRENNDYRFVDEPSGTDTTNFSIWKQNVGVDQHSIISQNPQTLVAKLQNPSLPANDPNSYLRVSGSEGYTLQAGANIDTSQYPWTKWFGQNLTLSKSADKTQVRSGDIITYTINYTNGTQQSNNVKIEDPIPVGTTYQSGGTYDSVNNKVYWNSGNLTPGQTGTVTFQVSVN